jgi:hypothetical protein
MSHTPSGFVVEEFVPVTRNTLRGFARIRMQRGLIVADVAFHQRDGRAWASPPAKPMLGRGGSQMKGADSRPSWPPIISFASRETRDRWSEAVLAALHGSHPNALDEPADPLPGDDGRGVA